MPYFLLVIGLIIIFVSLKAGVQIKREATPQNSFTEILAEQIKDSEIIKLKDDIKELTDRINTLEDSILLLQVSKDAYSEHTEDVLEINLDSVAHEELKEDICSINISEEKKSLNDMIYELSDKGLDIEDICSTLGLGKGEVLLRLGLRKQKK